MIHRCENCPGYDALQEYLENTFQEHDFDTDEEMSYSQWESTDRTTLRTHTASIEDFIESLVYKIDNLTTHSFIARSQSHYLKQQKTNLNNTSCIILLDFAENYHFVVQDEIQGYHWNKDQCTLHPVVIYYKGNDGALLHDSLCFLSDDLEHDTSFVHELQRITAFYIKETMPAITNIQYFSDGCAGQYKNLKNFLNLCFHKDDFGLSTTWSFFATSHGKSPCDGIGGTVKRKIARTSLQRPVNNQILSFKAVETFCESSISGIKFFTIKKDDMTEIRERLEKRYKLGSTVPGTRNSHYFEPVSTGKIQGKFVCADTPFSICHTFSQPDEHIHTDMIKSLKPMDYVTCIYDNYWWLALVEEVNDAEKDVTCKFLKPHGPSENFYWPVRDDTVYIPYDKILLKVATPNSVSSSGRQYCISKKELQLTVKAFQHK